jgi:rubrerythrin
MGTTAEAGIESNVIDMLNDLIQLNYDAIHAYEAAIDRIDNGERRRQLTAFKEDHERHARELDRVIGALHGKPVNGAVVKLVMTAGKIAIADMMSDKAVLKALKNNLEDIKKA